MITATKLVQKLSLATVGAAFMAVLNPQLGQAATLVTSSINQASPNAVFRDICPEFLCDPSTVFSGDNFNINNRGVSLLNNTNFTITGINFRLAENQDASWGQVLSDIFSQITLSDDAREISYSGGSIPVGSIATFRVDSGDTVVNFSTQFSGVPVSIPEPDSELSILILGVIGAASYLKKKQKRCY